MPNETPPDADRVVKGIRMPGAIGLGPLARDPDLDELLAAYPRLTRDDVTAVLADAHDPVASQREPAGREPAPIVASAMGWDSDATKAPRRNLPPTMAAFESSRGPGAPRAPAA